MITDKDREEILAYFVDELSQTYYSSIGVSDPEDFLDKALYRLQIDQANREKKIIQ